MPPDNPQKISPAVVPPSFTIAREDREMRGGHRGLVVWLTGLSGAGKSTLANALEVALHRMQKRTYLLDGDNIRRGLCKDLGFSDADRVENMRRVAEVARLFVDAGMVVLVAFISPFRGAGQAARELFAPGDFLEVFVDVPLAVAEQRDTKGLYQRARSGALARLTGIDSPHQPPISPPPPPTAHPTDRPCHEPVHGPGSPTRRGTHAARAAVLAARHPRAHRSAAGCSLATDCATVPAPCQPR